MSTTKIHADGIHFDLPMQDYLDDPALGSSDIVNLSISPLQYWSNSHMNPNRAPDEATEATDLGTIIHEALLEPGKRTFIVKPDGMSFATKDGKAWRDEATLANHTILTQKQARTLNSIMLAVEHSGMRKALGSGIPEVSYFWTTTQGFRCKIRLDQLQAKCAYDLKTYANIMNKDLQTVIAHQVAQYRYHVKAFWYHTGIQAMRETIRHTINDIAQADPRYPILRDIADTKPDARFPLWFVFLEKDGVPNVTIRQFAPKAPSGEINAYWKAARSTVEFATNTYATFMKEFGDEAPWIREAPMKTFVDEEFGAARWMLDE